MFWKNSRNRFWTALSLAFGIGALLWALSSVFTGHKEPWDSKSGYYYLGIMLAGFFPSIIAPGYFWLWPVITIIGQQTYMIATGGLQSIIGIFFLFLFSIQCFYAAAFGAVVCKVREEFLGAIAIRPEASGSDNRAVLIFAVMSVMFALFGAWLLLNSAILSYKAVLNSPVAFSLWGLLTNVIGGLVFAAPFFFLSISALGYSRGSGKYSRPEVQSRICALMTVCLLYWALKYIPFRNLTSLGILSVVVVPFVPYLIGRANVLWARCIR